MGSFTVLGNVGNFEEELSTPWGIQHWGLQVLTSLQAPHEYIPTQMKLDSDLALLTHIIFSAGSAQDVGIPTNTKVQASSFASKRRNCDPPRNRWAPEAVY